MAPSSWTKTRYFHLGTDSKTTADAEPPSPFMVLLEICHVNDIAVTSLHQGHLERATRLLSSAIQDFGKIEDVSKVEGRTCTFHETLPGQASLPRFLEANHERDDYEDSMANTCHLFTNAMRLSVSNFPATFTSAWAVVHFNLGLARHLQAVQASGKAATHLLGIAAKHYKASLSPSFIHQKQQNLPKLIRAAALCNLNQCVGNKANDASQYQDQFTEAFEALDAPEDRVIFTTCVSFTAMAA